MSPVIDMYAVFGLS